MTCSESEAVIKNLPKKGSPDIQEIQSKILYRYIEYSQKLLHVSRFLLKNKERENFPSSEDSKLACPILFE
jgi:hypothetical protein